MARFAEPVLLAGPRFRAGVDSMSILAAKSLSLTLGVPLFAGLSFNVEAGDRIGLVAANGRGKSSLLRCLAGALQATSGEITRARGTVVGLVEQDAPPALLRLSLRAAVSGALPADEAEAEFWRVDVILDDLEVPEALRDQLLGALSGGWQRAALLAQGATCVLASHDRSFVRAVGNRFWLIEGKTLVEVADPEAFFSGALR